MNIKNHRTRWNRLFFFCLGLSIAGTFAMKWIESDLIYKGGKISIFGLELFYSKEKIIEIFSGIDDKVRTILSYHLSFDFIFMAGVYPGIACLCMMAVQKIKSKNPIAIVSTRILVLMAAIQAIAWGFDIVENYYLLKWLKQPIIGNEFGFYHVIVYSKWIIALAGVLFALLMLATSSFKKNLQPGN